MVTVQDRQVSAWNNQVDARVKIAGSGPPLLFLHGGLGLTWDPFLDSLAEDFTVYAPEHPGTTPGNPDAIKPIDNWWDLVLYYYELLDALKIDSAAVIGPSFGGMVAAEIAATNPSRVSKLVLIGAIGLWRDDAPWHNPLTTQLMDLPKFLFLDQNHPMARMMSAGPTATQNGEPSEAALEALTQVMWNQACTGKFLWPIPDKGLKKRLHRITAPTLVLHGAQDRLVPPVYASEFGARIPNSQVELIEGSGHLPHIEQQEAVVPRIKEFLK